LWYREALYENESFPERELAALVAAKIYYHLQEYDESMVFALAAGKLFNIEQEGEFEDTIIGMVGLLHLDLKPNCSACSEMHRHLCYHFCEGTPTLTISTARCSSILGKHGWICEYIRCIDFSNYTLFAIRFTV